MRCAKVGKKKIVYFFWVGAGERGRREGERRGREQKEREGEEGPGSRAGVGKGAQIFFFCLSSKLGKKIIKKTFFFLSTLNLFPSLFIFYSFFF